MLARSATTNGREKEIKKEPSELIEVNFQLRLSENILLKREL